MTQHYIPGYLYLQQHHCENHKSCISSVKQAHTFILKDGNLISINNAKEKSNNIANTMGRASFTNSGLSECAGKGRKDRTCF
jgi:hypothetical protein